MIYVDTEQKLTDLVKELNTLTEIAVDLECENNLHYYGVYITLIQISSRNNDWIVDPLAIKNLEPLMAVFRDKKIIKVFHDITFDFRILNKQYGCLPKNFFDTQIAASFLGMKMIGLGYLLEKYFQIKKEKKMQKADWTKRPLTNDMLSYAVGDTSYLLPLKDKLEKELKQQNRLEWLNKHLLALEDKNFYYKGTSYHNVKNYSSLSPRQRSIFKQLFLVREELAKKVNRPVHFVISNKMLIELTQNLPSDWSKLKGVHPTVKKNAQSFLDAIKLGQKEEIEMVPKKVRGYNESEKKMFALLSEIVQEQAEKLKIKKELILNKEDIKKIIERKSFTHLASWQRELVEKEFLKKNE